MRMVLAKKQSQVQRHFFSGWKNGPALLRRTFAGRRGLRICHPRLRPENQRLRQTLLHQVLDHGTGRSSEGPQFGPWKHISMVRSTDCAASAPLPKSSESEERHFLAGRIITLLDAGLFTGFVAVLPRVMNPVPKVVVVEVVPPSPRVMTPFPNFDVVVDPPALSRLM